MAKMSAKLIAEKFCERFPDRFIYYRAEWYKYDNSVGYYRMLSDKEFDAQVMRFIQSGNDFGDYDATRSTVGDVVANLMAMLIVGSRASIPFWLRDLPKDLEGYHLINVKNGILAVPKRGTAGEIRIVPHTHDFFTLGALDFDYVPGATCPTWHSFLVEMVPDEETRSFLQEWFGYNMIFDTTKEKFVILYGMGANGKTVIVTVLKVLVGSSLYSSVPLESFSMDRTFPMTEMIGKLANICAEIGEVDRDTDAILKMIVSGEDINMEKKFKPPFRTKVPARLTFATNVFPKFRDSSSALPRRLVFINMDKQILDEKKQRKEFLDPEFWIGIGEMSGVLEWALEGLQRIEKNGYFTMPKKSKEDADRQFLDLNPAKAFLLEAYEPDLKETFELSPTGIYTLYSEWCAARGHKPLNLPNFTKEILRTFPMAKQEKNAVRRNGVRVRHITGIRRLSDIKDSDAEVLSIVGG